MTTEGDITPGWDTGAASEPEEDKVTGEGGVSGITITFWVLPPVPAALLGVMLLLPPDRTLSVASNEEVAALGDSTPLLPDKLTLFTKSWISPLCISITLTAASDDTLDPAATNGVSLATMPLPATTWIPD